MRAVRVPKDLAPQPRFLPWHTDLAFIWIVATVVGTLLNHVFFSTLIGTIRVGYWRRKTQKEWRSCLLPRCYWYLGFPKIHRMLPSSKRHFIG